ncbi:rhamnulokinase, partial [bacterium]|nr:rhamnulokinase [bacterium]
MKANSRYYLGYDLGASSGRAVLGSLENGRLRLQEIHRFANAPVDQGGSLTWDFPVLWRNVRESLRLCRQNGYRHLAGIGVDTWGVDFGLLGKDGRLIGNPLCYRDDITARAVPAIRRSIGANRLYQLTGLAPGRVTTLAQLVGMTRAKGDQRLRRAATFLMIPDLFRYFLCGHRAVETTPAGSSALVNVRTGRWCAEVFR